MGREYDSEKDYYLANFHIVNADIKKINSKNVKKFYFDK